jgi:hypothetical protein
MIRLVALALVLLVVVAVASLLAGFLRRARSRMPTRTPKQRLYDWERRTDQLYRRAKSVPAPSEERDRIMDFLQTRSGVEAFVEPKTVIHPLSVVLVADDGEWIRVALRDDAYLRELARTRGLKVVDASRVGYPERMRRYKRPELGGGGSEG